MGWGVVPSLLRYIGGGVVFLLNLVHQGQPLVGVVYKFSREGTGYLISIVHKGQPGDEVVPSIYNTLSTAH